MQRSNKLSLAKQLPTSFVESLNSLQGFDQAAFIEAHEAPQRVTSIRLNPSKPTPAIASLPVEEQVPWCDSGRYLSERPSFTLDPVFHGGAYYVQEASSMFLQHVVKELYKDADSPKHVLDLCAAPGGKSTLLASALPDSFIVSNEVIKSRVSVLAENITKWGSANVVVTNNDPKDFRRLTGFFDLLVVDAPCSGSGLFRKDADAIDEWSEANVALCSLRQQRILADAIDCLQVNGYLIYSTCSYSREEDEDVCDWLIEQFQLDPVRVSIDESWGIIESFSEKHEAPAYRFYPNKVKGEGFFIACFRQCNAVHDVANYNNRIATAPTQVQTLASSFINNSDDYNFSAVQEIIIASPNQWQQELTIIQQSLNVRKSGVAIGSVKGKDFIPYHELALSRLVSASVPSMDLDKEQALQYLRRQDFNISTIQKGWALCTYEDINLGWVKVLPNRVNNYYPTKLRILNL